MLKVGQIVTIKGEPMFGTPEFERLRLGSTTFVTKICQISNTEVTYKLQGHSINCSWLEDTLEPDGSYFYATQNTYNAGDTVRVGAYGHVKTIRSVYLKFGQIRYAFDDQRDVAERSIGELATYTLF